MGMKDMIIGVILTGLFAVGLISFGIFFAVEQGSTNSIADDEFITQFNETLQSNLGDVKGTAENQRESLGSQEAQGGDEGFSLTSIVPIALNFITLMFGTFGILTGALEQILGIPSIVINVIFGGLVITMLLLAWRVIKAGGT